jgi:hypothetical protein
MHHELLFQFRIISEIVKPVDILCDALNAASAHGKLLLIQDSTVQHRYMDIHILSGIQVPVPVSDAAQLLVYQ